MQSDQNFALKVDDTLREYLKEIRTALQDTESEAERELQITSALEEIEGKEVRVATDVECSRILETLIESAPTELLLQLAERIATRDALFTIACNPFGSHVLEKLLLQLQHALCGDEPEKALKIVGEMISLLKEDLIDYITHKFATFFARRLLQLLTGQLSAAALESGSEKKQDIADKVKLIQQNSENAALADGSGKAAQNQAAGQELAFQAEFEQHLHTLVQEVCGHGMDAATLFSLQRSTYASPFLQALLPAVTDKAQVATLICHMLGASPEDSEAHTAALSRLDPAPLIAQMKHKTASHMVEAIFLSCPHKLYDAIFKAISNTFPALCVNPVANYAAQSLIAAAPAARNVGDIFHSLKGSLEDCLLRGRSGVACLLVAACSAWRIECEDCCKAVQDVFPDGVVQGLAMLGQAETLPEAIEASHASRRPPRLSVNGCIILKAMLSMPQSACRAVTDALVALDSASAEFLAADPSGARVLETLLKGSAPKPIKRKLVGLLQGSYVKLAKLGAASRLVESLFMWCDVADKQLIAQPLADHLTEIKASKYGEPLCQAFQLELFKAGADEWRKRMHSSAKIKAQYEKLFADSIAKEAKAKRKSKKRKGKEENDTDACVQEAPAKQHRPVAADGPVLADAGPVELNPGEMEERDIKKKKKRKSVDSGGHKGDNTECPTDVSEGKNFSAVEQQHGDAVEVPKHKKEKKSKGKKEKRASKHGQEGQADEAVKPATDVNSVVDEVMAELGIGSGGSGGKKAQKKSKDVGTKKEKKLSSKSVEVAKEEAPKKKRKEKGEEHAKKRSKVEI